MTDNAPGHRDSGLVWFTSSHSSSEGGDCVEVASCPHAVHVRDTKDRNGPQLALTPAAWSAFVGYAAGDAVAPN
jgi:hypothetical protein